MPINTILDQGTLPGVNPGPDNGLRGHQRVLPVSNLRRVLPQYLAAIAKNTHLFDLGIVIGFPTIVIPALLNAKEGLSLDIGQASWLGSLVHFFHPLGSLTSAVVLDSLGRKRSMVILNIPFLLCWLALYYVDDITLLFVLISVLGFSIGSIEASIMSYMGEISEPSLRGVLTSLTQISENMGFVFIFVLGAVTDWHTSALISAAVPVISAVCLLQVPETPMWLLSRGRADEALKSLRWLRGWVKPELVQTEFDQLVRYNFNSNVLSRIPKTDLENNISNSYPSVDKTLGIGYDSTLPMSCLKQSNFVRKSGGSEDERKDQDVNQSIPPLKETLKEKLGNFFRRETMQPMFMMCCFFFFTYGSGLIPIRPYMVPVFRHLGFSIDPFIATAVLSAMGLVSCALCTLTVSSLGKRPLALGSVAGCCLCALALAAYTFYIDVMAGERHSWIPQTLMLLYAFFTGVGLDPLPWMYLSEVFPFRGRVLACGVAAGLSNFMGFIAAKTFLYLENALTLAGVFCLYGIISFIGCIYFYFFLLETEGKSLEEIEEHFKKKQING